MPSHLFVMFSPSQMAVVLVNAFSFLFIRFLSWRGGRGSAPPVITSTSLAPLKYEAIAFLCQMSYRLTFK